MRAITQSSWIILLCGVCVLLSGLLGTIYELIHKHQLFEQADAPIDFGAQITMGLFALLIADALIKIEKRLAQIEKETEKSKEKSKES